MGSPTMRSTNQRGNKLDYLPICTSPMHRIPHRLDGVQLDTKTTYMRSLIPNAALENWSHKASEQSSLRNKITHDSNSFNRGTLAISPGPKKVVDLAIQKKDLSRKNK